MTEDPYATRPVTAVPAEVTEYQITYRGKLNLEGSESKEPLRIEIPMPVPGLYQYTVTIRTDHGNENLGRFPFAGLDDL